MKSSRISEIHDRIRIHKVGIQGFSFRVTDTVQRFCTGVAVRESSSHPNLLKLFCVPNALEEERVYMVSWWMAEATSWSTSMLTIAVT